MQTFAQELMKRLIDLGFAAPDDFAGCSEEELDRFRMLEGLDCIPASYKDIMKSMGQKGLDKMFSATWKLDKLIGLRKGIKAIPLIAKYIPNDALIFISDPGGYYFMRTNPCVDNPCVYFYMRGPAEKVADTLSDFLNNQVEMLSQLMADDEESDDVQPAVR